MSGEMEDLSLCAKASTPLVLWIHVFFCFCTHGHIFNHNHVNAYQRMSVRVSVSALDTGVGWDHMKRKETKGRRGKCAMEWRMKARSAQEERDACKG